MLLLLAVPVLNFPALLFMMVPYVALYTTLSRGAFLLHLVPVWILAGLIAGPGVLIIGLFFLVPSIAMGHLYRKGAPAAKVIRIVTLILLAQLMLELLLFEMILDLSLLDEMSRTIRSTFESLGTEYMTAAGWSDEHTELLIQTVIHMIPLTFIIMSFVYAVLSHYVARRVALKSGIDVPAFPQAKDWRLPRVLVIYYLIAYVIDLVLKAGDDSFLAVAVMNLVPLLSYVFAIQAIGFFFFIAHERGWNKAVPVLIAIPVLLIQPLSLIGVLDTAFPIRKSFTKSK
ncbi:YybS family protein [Paenibacillus soyae]|uniref:YybS family protein n=1 Tax=Paenibacillus soyae TaxID=2969249 RepID=A0A9X2MR56_9BACL|nr:YybS family protein [Paenibacillus soyae]MCR2805361.1 YybS family protein [Paenibacillus soyae]